MMAEVIAAKAVHEELRTDAEQMIEVQRAYIELLTGYLTDTHGQDVEPDPAFVMSPDMMAELESASAEEAEQMFLLITGSARDTSPHWGGQMREASTAHSQN